MRGFRSRSSLISDPREKPRFLSRLRRSFLRPSAEDMSACGRHDTRQKLLVAREKKPLVPRVVNYSLCDESIPFVIANLEAWVGQGKRQYADANKRSMLYC